jgi:calcineurin-like phosphoesterase family protein
MRDFYFSLRGRKHLIVGNHDGKMTLERLPWESIDNYKELYYKKTKVVLSHYPFNIGQWNAAHHGSIHLYGHVHGNPQYNEPVRALDVGIDSIGFAPISMEAVYKKMMNIPKFVPYHERNKGK